MLLKRKGQKEPSALDADQIIPRSIRADRIKRGYVNLLITDTDGDTEGDLWYDASEDKVKFKTAAGVVTVPSYTLEAHESTHVSGGSDDIDSALAIAAMANLTNSKIWQGNASNRPVEVAMPSGGYTEGARVYHDADQPISDDTNTYLAFNSERYDTDAIHDNVTNNSRLTCKTAGKYIIVAMCYFPKNDTGVRRLQIKLNNTTIIGYVTLPGHAVIDFIQTISSIWDMAVNDYVQVNVCQTSGGNLNVSSGAAFTPEFMMQRIG